MEKVIAIVFALAVVLGSCQASDMRNDLFEDEILSSTLSHFKDFDKEQQAAPNAEDLSKQTKNDLTEDEEELAADDELESYNGIRAIEDLADQDSDMMVDRESAGNSPLPRTMEEFDEIDMSSNHFGSNAVPTKDILSDIHQLYEQDDGKAARFVESTKAPPVEMPYKPQIKPIPNTYTQSVTVASPSSNDTNNSTAEHYKLDFCVPHDANVTINRIYAGFTNVKQCDKDTRPCIPASLNVTTVHLPVCPSSVVIPREAQVSNLQVDGFDPSKELPLLHTTSTNNNSTTNNASSSSVTNSSTSTSTTTASNTTIPAKNSSSTTSNASNVTQIGLTNTNLNTVAPPGPEKITMPTLPTVPEESMPPPTPITHTPIVEPIPTYPPTDLTGYKKLERLIGRVQNNIRLEQNISAVDWKINDDNCNVELKRLNATIASIEKNISVAEDTIAKATQKRSEILARMSTLQQLMEPKLQLIKKMEVHLANRKAKREHEADVFERKKNDTFVVYKAVETIFLQLNAKMIAALGNSSSSTANNNSNSSASTTTLPFREHLSSAAAVVSDPHLHSLIENAVTALDPTVAANDVKQLGQLMGLLLSELQDYLTSLDTNEKSALSLYKSTMAQLQSQKKLWDDAVNERKAQIKSKEKQLHSTFETLTKAQELTRTLPELLANKKHAKEIWEADCTSQTNEFKQETVERNIQKNILAEMMKMLLSHDYITGRILTIATKGVNLPALLISKDGKRCCRVCKTGVACGKFCIAKGETCNIKLEDTCACQYDDMIRKDVSVTATKESVAFASLDKEANKK